MRRRRVLLSLSVACMVTLARVVAAQARAPEPLRRPALTIEEPAPGQFVSGVVKLRARLEPEGVGVRRLSFAADGRPVCTREAPPWECDWDAGTDPAVRTIRAVALLSDGVRLVDTVRTREGDFAPFADVAVVQVAATVSDAHGRLVKGLGRGAFRVLENGEQQEVTHFIGEDAERELVVAVDMSGSMGPAMPVCRDAVRRFLSSLRPIDHVTLLAFNDSVFTVARRETAPEARLRAVDRLRSWGSTAFYDAVLRGLTLLDQHRGRRALVLFTDGEDMVSHATVAEVQARIEVSATPVYVVAQGRGMREPALKRVLDGVAGVSGGRAFYSDRIEQLDGLFAEIAEDLASQYLLAYSPADAADDGSWRAIRVEVPGKKFSVRARQGYRAVKQGR
jgi:VWFA-related protein